jgi:phage-related protein
MLKVQFYQTENGVEPVRKWLKEELTEEDRKIIGEDVKTVQEGFPMGMPLVRSLGSGLWEVRSNITGKRIARILFFHHADRLILLHGFVKKTQKTPNTEINKALDRLNRLMN